MTRRLRRVQVVRERSIEERLDILEDLEEFTLSTALKVDKLEEFTKKIALKTVDLGHNLECTESGLLDFINEVVDQALKPHQEQIKKLEDRVAKLTKELEESKNK